MAIVALANGPTWLRAAALAGAELVGSFAVMCFDIPHNALRATITPDQMRSRVAGAYSSLNYGIRPLGALAGGLLGSWLGVRETLLISAVGGAGAILWLIPSPIIRVHNLNELENPTQPSRTHNLTCPAIGRLSGLGVATLQDRALKISAGDSGKFVLSAGQNSAPRTRSESVTPLAKQASQQMPATASADSR